MNNIAIRVENLGKRYRIGELQRYKALRDTLSHALYAPARWVRTGLRSSVFGFGNSKHQKPNTQHPTPSTFWALKDVSFDIKQGEAVGIIGRNGAGKSTLLKILSRITEPTSGRAEIHGRIGSLLEVGTGFHPELTGRENIFLNGAILGMKKTEIHRKFDEMVAFAEVERFIDTPIKHYSSGMYVRLAFAVAAHLEPEILLVDEVLAVGDAAFQKKCLGKMGDVAKGGRTVLFVSHNMGAISELCNRAILFHQGRTIADDGITPVLEVYSRNLSNANGSNVDLPEKSSLPCSIIGLNLQNHKGIETNSFDINDDIIISIIFRLKVKIRDLHLAIIVSRNMTDLFYSFDTDADDNGLLAFREPGLFQAKYKIPRMFLKAGSYSVRITSGVTAQCFQNLENALHFQIEEISVNTQMKGYRKDRQGHFVSPGIWETEKLEPR